MERAVQVTDPTPDVASTAGPRQRLVASSSLGSQRASFAWSLRVIIGAAGATVEFYSVKVMEACMLLRHAETYRPDSMTPESAEELLADGPIGGMPYSAAFLDTDPT